MKSAGYRKTSPHQPDKLVDSLREAQSMIGLSTRGRGHLTFD
jgi:hypothetical protein